MTSEQHHFLAAALEVKKICCSGKFHAWSRPRSQMWPTNRFFGWENQRIEKGAYGNLTAILGVEGIKHIGAGLPIFPEASVCKVRAHHGQDQQSRLCQEWKRETWQREYLSAIGR